MDACTNGWIGTCAVDGCIVFLRSGSQSLPCWRLRQHLQSLQPVSRQLLQFHHFFKYVSFLFLFFFSHCPRVMSCSSFFMSCSFESIHLKKPLVDTPKESEASWFLSTCRKCAYRFAKICEKTMKNLQNPGKTKAY